VSGDIPDVSSPSPAADVRRLDEIHADLEGVDGAIRRLDDSSYGTCEVCGAEIAASRLEVEPLATRCADHVT